MSGKSTNPAVYVLPSIWIAFIFLTAVAADCQRVGAKHRRSKAFGKWQTDENYLIGWDLSGEVLGKLTSHSGDKSHQIVNQTQEGKRISSLSSVGPKVFSKENLQNFFLRFKPKQPRKTKVDAERRDQHLFTKRRQGSKKILPTRSFGWGSFWEWTMFDQVRKVLTQTIVLKWTLSAHRLKLLSSLLHPALKISDLFWEFWESLHLW